MLTSQSQRRNNVSFEVANVELGTPFVIITKREVQMITQHTHLRAFLPRWAGTCSSPLTCLHSTHLFDMTPVTCSIESNDS